MSIASEITRINTNIANSYTAVDNKNGTLPQTQNSANLATAINSIEVIEQATAEGESLSLANTKAMPYGDYVVKGKSTQEGEPSPINPSEIHSVADDVNLFDVGTISDYRNFYNDGDVANWFSINSNILNVIIQENGATMFYNKKQYKGNENYTIKLKSSMVGNRIFIKLRNANNTDWLTNSDVTISNMTYNSYYNGWFSQSSTSDFTLTVNIPTCLYCCFGFGFGSSNVGTTQTIENIKIQKGTVASPYSPYNQGTVTIKQRGKNLWGSDLKVGGYNIFGTFEPSATVWVINNAPIEVKPNTTYTISQKETPCQYQFTYFQNETYISYLMITIDTTNGYKNFTFTTPANCNKIYIQFRSTIEKINQGTYVMTTSDITKVQLEENSIVTAYEPYQGYDKTIQTEPLRSLPNGVKDTIEDNGIHRRVGRVVLDGSEDENWALSGTNTTGYYRFSSDIINNIVEKPSLNSQVVDILSNNYMKKSADNTYSLQTGICIATNGAIIIYDDNLKQYTVENFKTWLSTHNTEVLYPLATEEIEPLTQNQATTMLDIIKTGSYEGTTNIFTDEDVKPTMKVGYYKKG